jgi:N-formylglutamate deformylase
MRMDMSDRGAPWLEVRRGTAPLLLCFPHTGTELTPRQAQFSSPWSARKDVDLWVHLLYDFAHALGASSVRTQVSRSVIDVNRDPSGASLYPGQTTTELCPLMTFDAEPLYAHGAEPDASEIMARRDAYFAPYHAAVAAELDRLRMLHPRVVLYDAHSIRSVVPRLFEGVLPELNLGTYDGKSCSPELQATLERGCRDSGFSWVVNGRFKGGWTTRHYGAPERGVHAVQMELACRSYLVEPVPPYVETNWPAAYDPAHAERLQVTLRSLLEACLAFAAPAARGPV